MKIGFVGLGAMGQPMAANLAKRFLNTPHQLLVYDIDPTRATMAPPASSLRSLAKESDLVMLMLPEGRHVRSVLSEMTDAGPKKIFVDSSTIDIATSREMAALMKQKGHEYIDAPVSGGVSGAKAATLTFMVGREDLKPVESVLSAMGKRLFACKQQGAGLAAKLANNYILLLNNLSTAEGFRLAANLGLDSKLFTEIANVSTSESWCTRVNNPVPGVDPKAPSSREYNNGFGSALCHKDLNLAVEAAAQVGLSLPFGSRAPEIYERMKAEHPRKDFSVIYEMLAKW